MGDHSEGSTCRDGRHLALGQGGERPHEIESVGSGAGFGDRKRNTNLDAHAGIAPEIGGADPCSPAGETSGEVNPNGKNEGPGAERAGDGDKRNEGDARRSAIDPSSLGVPEEVVTTGAQYRCPVTTAQDKSSESHLIDIPVTEHSKVDELNSYDNLGFSIARTASTFSVESGSGDQCRICQQHTEEPLMELGCRCRGELAKAHRSCVDQWFGNKGTNKCEVCLQVATNVPPPASEPSPHFWVWRVNGGLRNGNIAAQRRSRARFHPLWAALFILVAGLLFDILISIFLGASALPVNIIIGVLVVLGLGTAARLVMECWHERSIRRNIQRLDNEANSGGNPAEQTSGAVRDFLQAPAVQSAAGASQVAPTV